MKYSSLLCALVLIAAQPVFAEKERSAPPQMSISMKVLQESRSTSGTASSTAPPAILPAAHCASARAAPREPAPANRPAGAVSAVAALESPHGPP